MHAGIIAHPFHSDSAAFVRGDYCFRNGNTKSASAIIRRYSSRKRIENCGINQQVAAQFVCVRSRVDLPSVLVNNWILN